MSTQTTRKKLLDWLDEWFSGCELDFYSLWVSGISIDDCYDQISVCTDVRVPLTCHDILLAMQILVEDWEK